MKKTIWSTFIVLSSCVSSVMALDVLNGSLEWKAIQGRDKFPYITNVVDMAKATKQPQKQITHYSQGQARLSVEKHGRSIQMITNGRDTKNPVEYYTSAPTVIFTPTQPGVYEVKGILAGSGAKTDKASAETIEVGVFFLGNDGNVGPIVNAKMTRVGKLNLAELLNNKPLLFKEGDQLAIATWRNGWHSWNSVRLTQFEVIASTSEVKPVVNVPVKRDFPKKEKVPVKVVAKPTEKAKKSAKPQPPAKPIKVVKRVFYKNFDNEPIGKCPAYVRETSGWAGGTTKMSVQKADSGDGNVLVAEIESFGQIEIDCADLQTGKVYRVSAIVNSRGAHRIEMGVRRTPAPYSRHGKLVTQVFESPRKLEFYSRPKQVPTNPLHIGFILRGHTTLHFDEILVEEVENVPPQSDNPEDMLLADPEWAKGNLLANSGFEVGFDGWYSRTQGRVEQNDDAFEGRNVFRLKSGEIISSYLDLPLRRKTLFVYRVKAVGGPARVSVYNGDYVRFLNGTGGTTKHFKVDSTNEWKTISFEWSPQIKEGQVIPYKKFYTSIRSDTEILVDGVEVRYMGDDMAPKDQPYAPRAALEFSLDVDAPCHVATVGEQVTLTVKSSQPSVETTIYCFDMDGKLHDSFKVKTKDYVAKKTFTPKVGAWRYTTAEDGDANHTSIELPKMIDGECTLLVAPVMPEIPLKDWHFGSHMRVDTNMIKSNWKLGWKWARMHDASPYVKWPDFEPKQGEYNFREEIRTLKNTCGHALLGNFDWIPHWAPMTPAGTNAIKKNKKTRVRYNLAAQETLPHLEKAAEELARQMKGVIDEIEFTNEPNLSGIKPEWFVETQKAAIRGFKKGDPDVKVIAMGGACPTTTPWMYDCIRLGGAKGAYAISGHAYGFITTGQKNGPQPLIDMVKGFEKELEASGAETRRVYDTESGLILRSNLTKHPNHTGNAMPYDSAQDLAKGVAAVIASGLDRWFYYASFTQSHPGDGGAYGVAEHDGSIKVPYLSMAVAISLLEGREFKGFTDENGVVVMNFAGRGEKVTMVWDISGNTEYAVPEDTDRIVSMWGHDVKLSDTVKLSKSPVYFITAE